MFVEAMFPIRAGADRGPQSEDFYILWSQLSTLALEEAQPFIHYMLWFRSGEGVCAFSIDLRNYLPAQSTPVESAERCLMADSRDTPDQSTVELSPEMWIRCNLGEVLVKDVDETRVKLGISKGRSLWVKRADLQIYQVIDGRADQRTIQKQIYKVACASVTEDVSLNPAMLSWLVAASRVPEGGDVPITLIGSGPVLKDPLAQLLSECGFVVGPSSAETEVLIVGRADWKGDELKELLDLRCGETLRVYSQEMFLGWMISGCDPFRTKNPELIQRLAGNHVTLQVLTHVFAFDWPTTFVSPSGPNADCSFDAPETGYLKHEGYRVGQHGPSTAKRHDVLRHCYLRGRVPSVFPDWYIEQWGTAASSVRLRKIAESIAAFCRIHKRSSRPSRVAIEDWESDLAWLYDNFYQGNDQFAWPGTSVW